MGGRDSQRFGRNAASFAAQVDRALARTNAPNSAAWQHCIRQSYLRSMRISTRVTARDSALATLDPPDFHASESTFEDFEEFVEVPPFFTGNPNHL
jgi:hypothetical protein